MKTLPHPIDVMKLMHRFISDAYKLLPSRLVGTIQFCLHENGETIDCYFIADGSELRFSEGLSPAFDAKLDASFSNWLRLAGGTLHPVLGVLTRRLKFSGDVSTFKKLIPRDLYTVDLTPYKDDVTDFERQPAATGMDNTTECPPDRFLTAGEEGLYSALC
jgi:SCP-2 sterol transfer family